jgi:hypothetical protein
MKTTATLSKMKSFGLLGMISLALSSCGSYTGVSYYANDGVYASPRKTVYEIPVQSNPTQNNNVSPAQTDNPNEFGSYFNERANTYTDLLSGEGLITSADQYVGSSNGASAVSQDYNNNTSQATWGGNPSKITVEVYNNPWFDYFYPGNPAAMWGYQGLYFNSLSRASFRGRWGWSAGWGMDPWGFQGFGWAADPWGFGFNSMGFGWNNWGWNNWGWGGNPWNNWGWGGWAFNNPSIYYGPYNYNRVQRYARNNRLNPRSRYRTSYAVNATRRGKSNQTRRQSSTYALRKNSLSVSGLRSYLRSTDNARVVDAYRNNTATRNSLTSVQNSRNTTGGNGRVSGSGTAMSSLRNSSSYTSNSVRNNSLVRTPRATRNNAAVRSSQTLGNQMYRNLTPSRSSYRSSNNGVVQSRSSVSPIRRTPSANSVVPPTRRSSVGSSNYRSSAPSRSSSLRSSSSSSSRSSSSSGSSNSSRSSSSSRRSSGRNN